MANNIKIPNARFGKYFSDFGNGLKDIIKFRPQFEKVLIPSDELREKFIEDPTNISMEDFYILFPVIISNYNPGILSDGNPIHPYWEYRLSRDKFLIKTDSNITLGFRYNPRIKDENKRFAFYIQLFGKPNNLDYDYLIDLGWDRLEDKASE